MVSRQMTPPRRAHEQRQTGVKGIHTADEAVGERGLACQSAAESGRHSQWRAAADRDRPQARAFADLGHVLINAGAGGGSWGEAEEAKELTPLNSVKMTQG